MDPKRAYVSAVSDSTHTVLPVEDGKLCWSPFPPSFFVFYDPLNEDVMIGDCLIMKNW